MDEMKRCTKCGLEYPNSREYFYKNGNRLTPRCKHCVNEQNTAYELAHPEQVRARRKRYEEIHREERRARKKQYEQEHKVEISERRKRYREQNGDELRRKARERIKRNPDAHRESKRRWREANPEKAREMVRRWRAANPDKVRASWRQTRAKRRSADGSHKSEDIDMQYKHQRGRCYYCGVKVGKRFHVDHVVPLSRGGSNSPDNLVIACQDCNQKKHNKLPHEWVEGGRLL